MKMKIYKKTMNSFFWVLFIFITLSSLQLYSQITIGTADMPSPGDTVRRSAALNIESYDFELTGEDYVWDFSEFVSITQTVDTFVRVTETPLFYWPFFLLSANIASPVLTNSPIPELPLSNVYTFYHNSSDNYKDVGFAATILQIPLPFAYDDPDILYEFPMNYGNVDSSLSGFEFALEGIGYIAVEKKRINTVDGWGTLITPYGSFEVLRLKSEITEFDSIYIDSISTGLPVEREYTEYKWLGKDQKLPLLEVTDDLLSLIVRYIDSVPSVSTGTDLTIHQTLDFSCYPNPTAGKLSITYDFSGSNQPELRIYSLDGAVIYHDPAPAKKSIEIDLRKFDIQKGAYIIELSNDKQRFSKTVLYIN